MTKVGASPHLTHYASCLATPPSRKRAWWRMTGSNRRPPACKAGALPAELIPLPLAFDKRRIAALLHRLHSFRYAARSRALRCLLLKAHRLRYRSDSSPLSGHIGLRESSRTRRSLAPPTFCRQARRQRRHAPVIADQWWVWMGSNHRPPPYQDGALTS